MKHSMLGGLAVAIAIAAGAAACGQEDGIPPPEFKKGDTVYFFDLAEGKWAKGTFVFKIDDQQTAIMGDAGQKDMVHPKLLLTEDLAKERGLAEGSTQEERDAYVESVHAKEAEARISSDHPLIVGVVKEHNEIRRNPKAYADKIEQEYNMQSDQLDSVTKKAYETCIKDLRACHPLLPLRFAPQGAEYARTVSLALNGKHDDPRKIGAGWEAQGFVFAGMSLKFGGESIYGMTGGIKDDEAIGRGAVRALLIDGGKNNEDKYGHRLSILDFNSVSVDVPASQKKPYRHIGVAFDDNNIYMQYVCGQHAVRGD